MDKQMHLGVLCYSTGLHPAAWRLDHSRINEIGTIEFLIEVAQLAERGKLDAFFLADGQYISGEETGHLSYYFEPMTALAAIARETHAIGLVGTISSTFYEPFHAARLLSSLHTISQGRIGANIVTSQFDKEAHNYSMHTLPPLETRYERATEFIEVMKRLWSSFSDKAIQNDKQSGKGLDAQYIQPIHHKGTHFYVDGALNIPSSDKLGRPLLFQAGTSIPGRNVAAQHVDAIFSIAWNKHDAKTFRDDIHQRAQQFKRTPPFVLPGLTVYVHENEQKAYEMKEKLDSFIPLQHKQAQLEKAIQFDTKHWELDEMVPTLPPYEAHPKKVTRSVYEAIRNAVITEHLTLRQLLERFSTWIGHKTIVGTPEKVADEMIAWFKDEACDGFMLMPPTIPESFNQFVNLVIPILQERSVFRKNYAQTRIASHINRH